MELILQNNLIHQQRAVDLICDVFNDTEQVEPQNYYENPSLDIDSAKLQGNIQRLQREEKIKNELQNFHIGGGFLNLDIKMETGTGYFFDGC